MYNCYYWEQYPIVENDFYLGQNSHLDKKIGGLVIVMDSDYPIRSIDLSGKGTTHKRLFDNYERLKFFFNR